MKRHSIKRNIENIHRQFMNIGINLLRKLLTIIGLLNLTPWS